MEATTHEISKLITPNSLRGRKAQRNGKQFEELIIRYCHRENIAVKKTDAIVKQAGGKIWRERAGVDFIFGRNSVAVFADTKSIDSDRISHSFLKPHQTADLKYWSDSGFTTGLIVYFRIPNIISFLPIQDLLSLNPGESIKFHETAQLGSLYDFRLDRLFTWAKDYQQSQTKTFAK